MGVSLEAVQTKGFQATSQDMCGAFGRFVTLKLVSDAKLTNDLGKVSKAFLSITCHSA
jgi:hypothetical protein